jgi:hypothetical protein
MRDILSDDASTDDISNLAIDEVTLPPTFAMPEATSPAMDATFYYVLCTMSLVAAAFGNFLIVSQNNFTFGLLEYY